MECATIVLLFAIRAIYLIWARDLKYKLKTTLWNPYKLTKRLFVHYCRTKRKSFIGFISLTITLSWHKCYKFVYPFIQAIFSCFEYMKRTVYFTDGQNLSSSELLLNVVLALQLLLILYYLYYTIYIEIISILYLSYIILYI